MNWNPETNHMMVDLETLGLNADAVVISAGWTIFNSDRLVLSNYVTPEWTQPGRKIDPETAQFWLDQVSKGKQVPVGQAVLSYLPQELRRNYLDYGCETIWSQGIDFDIPMLKSVFAQCKIELPWKYNAVRDCRTVFKLFESTAIPEDITNQDKHNALADAEFQARKLQFILGQRL